MGSQPIIPSLKGIDRKNVFGAEDIYYYPEHAGQNVVILGGGLVGLELGVFLAQKGREVTVVEMPPRTCASPDDRETSERMSVGAGLVVGDPLVHGIAIREYLSAHPDAKMTILASTRALEITDGGVRVAGHDGERTIAADTVVYAVGQKPLHAEAQALASCSPEFYAIGDCVTPRNIFAATQAAWAIARDIGRI